MSPRHFAKMNRNMESPYFPSGQLKPHVKKEMELEDQIARIFKKIFLFWKKSH